ncbi:MAG: TRAP transporter substrate-binding protein DctP [Betaproteobacteria bacterium]|nr:TRAP transporter substrate-binding protein DctP [Betaproteobacteria bacterium]
MRKIFSIGVLLAASLALVAVSAGAATAQTYTFKWAGRYSKESVQAKTMEQYFMSRVTELSKGRIKWDYYPHDQLAGMNQMLDAVAGGTADFGMLIPAIYTGKIPVIGAQDLPFLFDADVAGHIKLAAAMMAQPEYKNSWDKFGVKLIGGDSQGTQAFYLKQPLTKLEDFKGRKIRSAGRMQSETVKALGGAAQSLASHEVYLALQTGVLDGTMWQPDSAVENRIYEVTKYAIIPAISVSGYTTARIANAKVWNSLPADLQKIIMQAEQDTQKNSIKTLPAAEEEAIKTLEAKGMHIYRVPREENLRWRDATRGVWDAWLKRVGAPGKALVDFVLKELGQK